MKRTNFGYTTRRRKRHRFTPRFFLILAGLFAIIALLFFIASGGFKAKPADPVVNPNPGDLEGEDTPQPDVWVMIDPGHGGDLYPGCYYGGYRESDLDLQVALKVRTILENNGYGVLLTRDDDSEVGLYERTELCNESEAQVFLSIHANAFESDLSVNGISTWYNGETNEENKIFAGLVQNHASLATGARNRGLSEDDELIVIRETNVPCCLIEIGFMSNETELANLVSDDYQQKLAQGLADAIMEYLESKAPAGDGEEGGESGSGEEGGSGSN
ncbi:MAG: N-acetylmuramoyl-L-alanine amidase [Firmicutes bacterium]|nr:N-acetylmuramoyl-L-alanine amidase [Bacillota bacterium]